MAGPSSDNMAGMTPMMPQLPQMGYGMQGGMAMGMGMMQVGACTTRTWSPPAITK